MRGMYPRLLLALVVIAACGGGKKPVKPAPRPRPVVSKPAPRAAPACIKGGDAMGAIGQATSTDGGAAFCVSDGSATECFQVDLASARYEKRKEPPTPQPAAINDAIKVETTATEVKVCKGDACKSISPKLPKGSDGQLVAAANESHAVVMVGNSEAGKGVAEVWDLGKNKKVSTIKYAKSDFKCGVPRMLGSTVYISASVCAGPAARATLYNVKGKRIGDVGGKEFGTFSEIAVQVEGNLWAFLEENGSVLALQDVANGKVHKTISLAALWAAEGTAPSKDAPPMGNPGESAMVRGAPGTLLVISGSPTPGNVAVIDVASGDVKIVRAPACK